LETITRNVCVSRGDRRMLTQTSIRFGCRFEMLTSRLLGVFVVVSALVSPGAEFAVARDAPANDFSSLLEWKNQIAADLEHNKRYRIVS